MTTVATTSTFGTLLRDWRRRRRLTQLDLGLQADVSARHLSFLETGRSRPSRDMVLHLAEELEVPLRARNELMTAAGFAPAYTEHGLDDGDLAEVRTSLRRILTGHEPYPAALVDGQWNLLAANAALPVLLEPVDPALLAPPVNVLRLALHPRGLARHVVDLPEYAAHLLSRVRRQAERSARTGLMALVTELTAHCRELGLDPHARPHGTGTAGRIVLPLRLRHPRAGELAFFSTVSVLGAPLDVTLDEVAIEAFFPADDHTAEFLRTSAGQRLP